MARATWVIRSPKQDRSHAFLREFTDGYRPAPWQWTPDVAFRGCNSVPPPHLPSRRMNGPESNEL
jgi:hypothetical protein